MTKHCCIIEAYDDGFFPPEFKGGKGDTFIVGVKTSGFRVLDIAVSRVLVDGGETYKRIVEMSGLLNGELIMLDGVTYAGFDVVDPFLLHSETGKPVVAVQLYPLNLERVRSALLKHFPDGEERFRVVRNYYESLIPIETAWRIIQVMAVGIDLGRVVGVLRHVCIYSPEPEPLRIADKIASSLSKLFIS